MATSRLGSAIDANLRNVPFFFIQHGMYKYMEPGGRKRGRFSVDYLWEQRSLPEGCIFKVNPKRPKLFIGGLATATL